MSHSLPSMAMPTTQLPPQPLALPPQWPRQIPQSPSMSPQAASHSVAPSPSPPPSLDLPMQLLLPPLIPPGPLRESQGSPPAAASLDQLLAREPIAINPPIPALSPLAWLAAMAPASPSLAIAAITQLPASPRPIARSSPLPPQLSLWLLPAPQLSVALSPSPPQ